MSRPPILAEVEALLGLAGPGGVSTERRPPLASDRLAAAHTLKKSARGSGIGGQDSMYYVSNAGAVSMAPSIPKPPIASLNRFQNRRLVYRVRCVRRPHHRILVMYVVEGKLHSAMFTAIPCAAGPHAQVSCIGPQGDTNSFLLKREPDAVAGSWLPYARRKWGAQWWDRQTVLGSIPSHTAGSSEGTLPRLPEGLERAAAEAVAKSVGIAGLDPAQRSDADIAAQSMYNVSSAPLTPTTTPKRGLIGPAVVSLPPLPGGGVTSVIRGGEDVPVPSLQRGSSVFCSGSSTGASSTDDGIPPAPRDAAVTGAGYLGVISEWLLLEMRCAQGTIKTGSSVLGTEMEASGGPHSRQSQSHVSAPGTSEPRQSQSHVSAPGTSELRALQGHLAYELARAETMDASHGSASPKERMRLLDLRVMQRALSDPAYGVTSDGDSSVTSTIAEQRPLKDQLASPVEMGLMRFYLGHTEPEPNREEDAAGDTGADREEGLTKMHYMKADGILGVSKSDPSGRAYTGTMNGYGYGYGPRSGTGMSRSSEDGGESAGLLPASHWLLSAPIDSLSPRHCRFSCASLAAAAADGLSPGGWMENGATAGGTSSAQSADAVEKEAEGDDGAYTMPSPVGANERVLPMEAAQYAWRNAKSSDGSRRGQAWEQAAVWTKRLLDRACGAAVSHLRAS